MYTYKGTVTNVVDGDTIDVRIDLGFRMTTEQRLRLYGINTPELDSKEPEERERAQQAKQFTTDMVLGKEVIVETYKSDSFGRYLACVFIPSPDGDISLNNMLLEKGLAVKYVKH